MVSVPEQSVPGSNPTLGMLRRMGYTHKNSPLNIVDFVFNFCINVQIVMTCTYRRIHTHGLVNSG